MGSKFLRNLSKEIINEFPSAKGFSVSNLKNMAKFLGHPNATAIKISHGTNHICYDKKLNAGCTKDTKLSHTSTTKNLNRLNGMIM